MRIKTANDDCAAIGLPGFDDRAEFNDDGVARVTAELGEALADEYDDIEIVDTETSD